MQRERQQNDRTLADGWSDRVAFSTGGGCQHLVGLRVDFLSPPNSLSS